MKKHLIAALALLLFLHVPSVLSETVHLPADTVSVSFPSNITTGYEWTGVLLSGDSVSLSLAAYVSDPNPDLMDGIGGKTVFTFEAVRPGQSIAVFTYMRKGEGDIASRRVFLAEADQQLHITLQDLSETGVYWGTVLFCDPEAGTALVLDLGKGPALMHFDQSDPLPSAGDSAAFFTDGIRSSSVLPEATVLFWTGWTLSETRNKLWLPFTGTVRSGTLTGVRYTCSGNDLGNVYEAELFPDSDGVLVLTVKEKEVHSQPLTITRYFAKEDALLRISDIVFSNNMTLWEKRTDYLTVMDAAIPYLQLIITRADGSTFIVSLNGLLQLNEQERFCWQNVLDILFECV